MGIVFNIQRFCIHDGDGIRTCVFLKGCPLRCLWCHNPESQEKAPTLSFQEKKCTLCQRCLGLCDARRMIHGRMAVDRTRCIHCGKCVRACLNDANEIIGLDMTAEEVMKEVVKDRLYYETSGGGVTLTGGEPAFQEDFSLELLRLLQKEGISRAMETCGQGGQDFYEAALALGTTFLYDLKCMDPALHQKLTGVSNQMILENLAFLMDRGADLIVRLPMIPGCNDAEENIQDMAAFLKAREGKYRYAELMPYHALGLEKEKKIGRANRYKHDNATKEEKERWVSLFKHYGIDVRVSQ